MFNEYGFFVIFLKTNYWKKSMGLTEDFTVSASGVCHIRI